jgi:hypothetical protein
MSTYNFIKVISEDECMGDSLDQKINPNFKNLDTGLSTLIQTLTSIGAPGTNYNSLSTIFINLSSLL